MTPPLHAPERGVALVVVLWVLLVLSLLIGGFAFTMHVETQVASYSRKALKAESLARSGIEMARVELLEHSKKPAEAQFEALNQPWAANKERYVNHALGEGTFNVTVVDEESRLPINQLDEEQLHRLLRLLDAELLDADVVVDSILDWIDGDDLHRLNGAETDYYKALPTPYRAKNGPLHRVEELLLIRGVTPELFHGLPATDRRAARPGLKDLFTTDSSGRININTAPAIVLQTAFNLDEPRVAAVLERRNGSDGILGTEDDHPFRTVDEFFREFGPVDPAEQKAWQRWASVRSTRFRVTATGEVGGVRRTITAILARTANDYEVLAWMPAPGGQP